MTKTQFIQKKGEQKYAISVWLSWGFSQVMGIKAKTHTHVEIPHFPTWCIIRAWKALGLWPHASQAPMMHLIGKCSISTWAWILAISTSIRIASTNTDRLIRRWDTGLDSTDDAALHYEISFLVIKSNTTIQACAALAAFICIEV